jgi:UDP-N-acetylglucosamine 2-epimerase (non-hydrolysing)
MTRVLVIFGTRPEAIKMAPIIHELEDRDGFTPLICSSGQHREMLDQVLDVFGIHPQWDLGVMQASQGLHETTAAVIVRVSEVIAESYPDIVLVQGDTTTAFAGALAAYYSRIPVGHVEAGLRTWDRYNPFPEEMNRALVDVLADQYFAPTDAARLNLLQTGVEPSLIHVTGNTVIDALMWARERIERPGEQDEVAADQLATVPIKLREMFSGRHPDQRMVLVTGHRRESFGEDFEGICRALKTLVDRNPDLEIAYPVHLNPQVREPVYRILGDTKRVHLFDPPPYLGFVWLMMRSHFLLTDSGGVQEEAPSLDKPVLVMRRVTERPEGVEAGCARVVGVEEDAIVQASENLLTNEGEYKRMSQAQNPYGDGNAARNIVDAIENWSSAGG